MSTSLLIRQGLFAATAATSLGTSGKIFRDLSDFSQWVSKPKRNNLMKTWRIRHELAQVCLSSVALNSAVFWLGGGINIPGTKGKALWAGINGGSLLMLFAGYGNPELMMRSRNRNALYVTVCEAGKIMKPDERVIVTQYGKDKDGDPAFYAYPEQQIYRPHVAGIPKDERGIPAVIAYCGLSGTGNVYETPDLPDGRAREYVPITQLENNLVVLEKTTGHIGHQINGIDETLLLEKMGKDSYDEVGKRPSVQELADLGMQPAKEVATWRMPLKYFVQTYPHGKVFINDYKEFPDLKTRPVLSMYDKLMDAVFYVAIMLFHNQWWGGQFFPTVDKVDPRLPTKQQVGGFNVGDHYVALTPEFVQTAKNGTRNLTVGDTPIIASWDDSVESLGIWIRPSNKPIAKTVDVHGKVGGVGEPLERVSTVKNGLFWYVWQNFFPSTTVNPEK